jgi:hypothetical protein
MDAVRKWESQGCSICRRKILSTGLPEIAVSVPNHSCLMRCDECGAFWEELERYAHEIDEAEARAIYPDAFGSGSPLT